jgi:hypothetical protein
VNAVFGGARTLDELNALIANLARQLKPAVAAKA